MNYKYSIPIFESGDEEEALDVIATLMHIKSDAYNDDSIDEGIKLAMKSIYYSVAEEAYGENIVLMANFIQTQVFYYKKVRKNLLAYLFHRNVKFNEISMDIAAIASWKIAYETVTNAEYRPVSRWNPNRVWNEEEFEYSSSYDPVNLTNPLNTIDHLSLELDDNEKVREFAKVTNDNTLRYLQCNGKVYLRLLPYASPVHLVNIMEGIYKVF